MNPLNPVWLEKRSSLVAEFRRALPFEHLVLDRFLEPSFCEKLAAEFPGLDAMEVSRSSYGTSERALYRRIDELGPACRALDLALRSAAFLEWAAKIAGGARLIRNPQDSCGGLFQDAHGMELDPHLDVNCTVTGHRRRLTLLLYLNQRWQAGWGGALELYSDPAGPPRKKLLPRLNRCVIFASHERSWHSYSRIALPPAMRSRGRRVLIVNFYGREAAARDGPPHYNVWMPRPLPARIKGGRALTRKDVATVRGLLGRRDALLRDLRALESSWSSIPAAPLPGLARRLQAGRALAAAQARELRRLFAGRDAELRRLYGLEFAYRRRPS